MVITKDKLNVVVDGEIYHLQEYGGISRLFNEILPRMCDLDDAIRIKLVTNKQTIQRITTHTQISHLPIFETGLFLRQNLRPRRVWNPLLLRACNLAQIIWIGSTKGKVWHSTYFTMPKKWNGSIVVTVHDMIYEHFPHLYCSQDDHNLIKRKRRCISEADAIICVSKSTKQDVQRKYDFELKNVHVIPHGYSNSFKVINSDELSFKLPTDKLFYLYVGSRTLYKNFDKLIQAYRVWEHRKDVALVVVGRPWSRDEVRTLFELGIQDRVHLLEKVDDEWLCYLYNKATAFIFPSLYEGFGIPLLEAMACGCPIVASRIPSTVEVAGSIPIYFTPGKVEDLVTALNLALLEGQQSHRTTMGLKLAKTYSWDKTAKQTLEVYRSIL